MNEQEVNGVEWKRKEKARERDIFLLYQSHFFLSWIGSWLKLLLDEQTTNLGAGKGNDYILSLQHKCKL